LPPHHRDPFDRMLIAQATLENMAFATQDEMTEPYGIPTIGLGRG
jgi:PIN domain nuclease of toxin-antitoxin system